MLTQIARPLQLALAAAVLTACFAAAPAGAATPQVSVGYYHSCAVEASGTVKCFGYNGDGESGPNNIGDYNTPTVIDLGGAKATGVGAAYASSCATLESGGVKCWGDGSDGQLGDGLNTSSTTPVDVAIGGFARSIVASYYSYCALMDGGAVKCWGDGGDGTNGAGSGDQPTPVSVDLGGHSAVSLVGGYSKVCAIVDDGGLWCWGSNSYEEIALSSSSTIYTPTQINLGSTSIKSVAADYEHICVVTTAGAVKCWGGNYYGQLGDGSTNDTDLSTPVTVDLGGEQAVDVVAAWYHSCAQLQSGAVKCWGDNEYGALGVDSSTSESDSPIDYAAHSAPISKVFANNGATCVSLTTGALECTGYYVPQYMDGTSSTDNQFGALLIAGVDMSMPAPPAPPTPAGPSPIAGKIVQPKWKLTRKGSKVSASSTLQVTAVGMDAIHCNGDLQVSVPGSGSGRSATAPTFALKYASGKCTASAKRTIPLRVSKKGAKLKVYLKNAKLLTASSVTSTTKLPK